MHKVGNSKKAQTCDSYIRSILSLFYQLSASPAPRSPTAPQVLGSWYRRCTTQVLYLACIQWTHVTYRILPKAPLVPTTPTDPRIGCAQLGTPPRASAPTAHGTAWVDGWAFLGSHWHYGARDFRCPGGRRVHCRLYARDYLTYMTRCAI